MPTKNTISLHSWPQCLKKKADEEIMFPATFRAEGEMRDKKLIAEKKKGIYSMRNGLCIIIAGFNH